MSAGNERVTRHSVRRFLLISNIGLRATEIAGNVRKLCPDHAADVDRCLDAINGRDEPPEDMSVGDVDRFILLEQAEILEAAAKAIRAQFDGTDGAAS